MLNKKTKGDTMTTKVQDYFETINQIDTKLYEINQIIRKFDNSIDNTEFLEEIIDLCERHISTKTKLKI